MQFSSFGEKFNQHSGITQLMDDLNEGLRTPGAIMLGGGNPAKIPAMLDYFHTTTQQMLNDGSLIDAMTNYDGPQGNTRFIRSLAQLLRDTQGWDITENNITLTNGSQSSFFYLFNLLAGQQSNGSKKKILLPLAPEYIGYADTGLDEDIFISYPPKIELLEHGLFKYHVDFDALTIDDSIAAICASRPTNPTGNMLTDDEIQRLDALARHHNIPLILDNAYGLPFPNIVFEPVTPFWNDNTILCMSLSKLGLPGVRCGIVIANQAITKVLSNMNGIINLSPGSIGPTVVDNMIQQGDLLPLSQQVIRPFYQEKAQHTVSLLQHYIPDPRFRIHKPEGAIFLWLWFDELPITSMELYHRLKARGVLVVPGEYFFIGQTYADPHSQQCIRMNYIQDATLMEQGIQILAEEITQAYRLS